MRTFEAEGGGTWVASVQARGGDDYKGRYGLVMAPQGGIADGSVELVDIRWNSEETAERTLLTMSEGELRRRHRSALGRSAK